MRSIKWRLATLYVASAFGVLFLSTSFLYWAFASRLVRDDTQYLITKVNLLREILKEEPNDPDVIREEVEWESSSLRLTKYYARLLNSRRETILETVGMQNVVPLNVFPSPTGLSETPSEAVRWKSKNGGSFLLMTASAKSGGPNGRSMILQLALDISPESDLIADYRRQLFVVLFAGILLFSIVGFYSASKGLKPIEEITRTVKHITATQLQGRLGRSNWPQELSELAVEFDGMLDRLEDSFDRLTKFSADISHELRTPINNLRGEVEVALSQDRTPDEYKEVLGSGIEEYDRLSHIIESLLFLARAESPEAHVEKSTFDAREQVEGLFEFYEAMAEERGVTLHCEGDEIVDADPTLFRQAISNLLMNAIQHTPRGGRILVELVRNRDQSLFASVRDDGTGIEAEHLRRVYDRFYRADPSRLNNKSGSGLGLAIVKSIMQLHRGTVSIVSEPGKGTTVTLCFPA